MRPIYAVTDVNRGPLLVDLYTPDPFKDAAKFKVGHTLCITDGTIHAFPDGRNGFRIVDPTKIEVRPRQTDPTTHRNVLMRISRYVGAARNSKQALGNKCRPQAA
jgi:hypothetical protein